MAELSNIKGTTKAMPAGQVLLHTTFEGPDTSGEIVLYYPGAKKSGLEKERARGARQLSALCERLLRLTSVLPGAEGASAWERHEEAARLLTEVTALERGARGKWPPRDGQRTLAAFTEWLAAQGAQFEGVEIAPFPGYGLGLRATKPFPAGAPLVSVPRHLMMTESDARASSLAPFAQIDPVLQNMPNVTLALFLLMEKFNPESFWKPYLDVLPETYNMVLYFTPEELQELKPSPVFNQALKLCRSIARQYSYLYGKIHSGLPGTEALREIFTYDHYRWAVSTVMTRQNIVAGVPAFIPLWDMCNHEHGKNTTEYSEETAQSECYALRDFAAGEQILIYYGVRSNADFFLHNGFVYPDNQQDSVTIPLGVSGADALRERRVELLRKLGLAGVTYYTLYSGERPLSPELLAFIRVFNMSADELTHWLTEGNFGDLVSSEADSAAAVGAALDRKAYGYLQTRCELVAASYRRAGGGKSLPDEELSGHRKNIYLLKQCELKVLERAIEYTKEVLEKLPKEVASQS